MGGKLILHVIYFFNSSWLATGSNYLQKLNDQLLNESASTRGSAEELTKKKKKKKAEKIKPNSWTLHNPQSLNLLSGNK